MTHSRDYEESFALPGKSRRYDKGGDLEREEGEAKELGNKPLYVVHLQGDRYNQEDRDTQVWLPKFKTLTHPQQVQFFREVCAKMNVLWKEKVKRGGACIGGIVAYREGNKIVATAMNAGDVSSFIVRVKNRNVTVQRLNKELHSVSEAASNPDLTHKVIYHQEGSDGQGQPMYRLGTIVGQGRQRTLIGTNINIARGIGDFDSIPFGFQSIPDVAFHEFEVTEGEQVFSLVGCDGLTEIIGQSDAYIKNQMAHLDKLLDDPEKFDLAAKLIGLFNEFLRRKASLSIQERMELFLGGVYEIAITLVTEKEPNVAYHMAKIAYLVSGDNISLSLRRIGKDPYLDMIVDGHSVIKFDKQWKLVDPNAPKSLTDFSNGIKTIVENVVDHLAEVKPIAEEKAIIEPSAFEKCLRIALMRNLPPPRVYRESEYLTELQKIPLDNMQHIFESFFATQFSNKDPYLQELVTKEGFEKTDALMKNLEDQKNIMDSLKEAESELEKRPDWVRFWEEMQTVYLKDEKGKRQAQRLIELAALKERMFLGFRTYILSVMQSNRNVARVVSGKDNFFQVH